MDNSRHCHGYGPRSGGLLNASRDRVHARIDMPRHMGSDIADAAELIGELNQLMDELESLRYLDTDPVRQAEIRLRLWQLWPRVEQTEDFINQFMPNAEMPE